VTALALSCAPPGRRPGGRSRARAIPPTDRELQAYVDGALNETRAAEVETALRRDEKLRRAVHLCRMLNHLVRLLYDGVLTEPLPERLEPHPAEKPRHH
jgi:anti-sigma factor RsiW